VHAIDGHPDGLTRLMHRDDHDAMERLTMQLASLERVELPGCDLLNASFSLPFCAPDEFEAMWARIVTPSRLAGGFQASFLGIGTRGRRSRIDRTSRERKLRRFLPRLI